MSAGITLGTLADAPAGAVGSVRIFSRVVIALTLVLVATAAISSFGMVCPTRPHFTHSADPFPGT